MLKKRIGILGGSFNPPHIGHAGICETVLKQKMAEEVWVIPCYQHPFGKILVPFEHRFRMCELAFEHLGNRVKILNVEKKLGEKSITLRTVEHLKKKHPDLEFVLLLGEDAAKEAKTWHRYDDLRNALSWVVIPRGPRSVIPDVSATQMREALRNNASPQKFLNENVLEYITQHQLYKESL